MAHEVFGERVIVRGAPAWHRLGTVIPVEEQLTASEAFVRAGMDFQFERVELTADFGTWSLPTGRYAVIRGEATDPKTGVVSQPEVVGVVGEDYTILGNMEIAAKFDPLSKEWPVETVGSLRNGSTVFLTLKVGGAKIAGEDYEEFFLCSDARDGSQALRIKYTPVRVVCQNTLTASLNGHGAGVSITHGRDLRADLDFWAEMIPAMQKNRAATKEALNELAKVRVSPKQVEDVLLSVYPVPPAPAKISASKAADMSLLSDDVILAIGRATRKHETMVGLHKTYREQAHTLYQRFGDEQPAVGGTAYALYNAVAEREDWTGKLGEINTASTLWGSRADHKQTAFDQCLALLAKNSTRQSTVYKRPSRSKAAIAARQAAQAS